ncbi:MAG: metal-sensing transcriptional repressor [Selenomonadaceae bacterium]|jgi:DNA-binding FrmR family transcriptional regulator
MRTERESALCALKISRGQVDGIIKMIEDDRYCIDIANQLLAAQSLLKKAELHILQGHMRHCVKEACQNNDPDEKIEELNRIMEKLITK